MINVFSFLFFFNNNKKHVAEIFSPKSEVFFEVQVWKVLIELEYLESILIELI